MESIGFGQLIVFGIIIFIIVMFIVLITIFKPGKSMEILASFREANGAENNILHISLNNDGKKKVKVVLPLIKFKSGTKAKLFQLKQTADRPRFPRIIEPGDKAEMTVNISPYLRLLRKKSFHPTSFKVIVKDTIGMKFQSDSQSIPDST